MVPKLFFIGDFRLSVDFGTDNIFYEDEIGIEGIIKQVEKRFSRAARSELNIKVDFSEHKVPYRMYVTQWRDFAKRIKKVIKTRDYRFELVTWEKNWKWKIGEQPFFALSMIWESYCELYKVAYEENMTTIAVTAFSGHNFDDSRYPHMTEKLLSFKKYPDMFSGYEIKVFGFETYVFMSVPHFDIFVSVSKNDGEVMKVRESLYFFDENYVRKFDSNDIEHLFTSKTVPFEVTVYVVCSDETLKTGTDDSDYETSVVFDSELIKKTKDSIVNIVAVNSQFIPHNNRYRKTDVSHTGAVITEKDYERITKEFNRIYDKWQNNEY